MQPIPGESFTTPYFDWLIDDEEIFCPLAKKDDIHEREREEIMLHAGCKASQFVKKLNTAISTGRLPNNNAELLPGVLSSNDYTSSMSFYYFASGSRPCTHIAHRGKVFFNYLRWYLFSQKNSLIDWLIYIVLGTSCVLYFVLGTFCILYFRANLFQFLFFVLAFVSSPPKQIPFKRMRCYGLNWHFLKRNRFAPMAIRLWWLDLAVMT